MATRPLRKLLRIFRRPSHPIEKKIGYTFHNRGLLDRAFCHRSYSYATEGNRRESNERMEFLGDAVVNLVVTQFLFLQYPTKQEGELSQIKSLVVSKKVLGEAARRIGLGKHLFLSNSEERSGGRNRLSIVADAFEALVAAIYLDGGLEPAAAFIHQAVLARLDQWTSDASHVNFKSLLLEAAQGLSLGMPKYALLSENGPDHNKTFEIAAILNDEEWGKGTGKSKKEAEQRAAHSALIAQKEILKPFFKEKDYELLPE